jgi:hypothetical protein
VHWALPLADANVPVGHASQLVGVRALPPSWKDPGSQAKQALDAVWFANLPVGQRGQLASPSTGAYSPTRHSLHWAWPPSTWLLPSGHRSQTLLPSADANVPGAQSRQVDEPL